jgi:predicted deacylase
MSRAPSRLSADIDFDKEGKQTGFVRLPHSVHRSAYGWIPIPVISIRNGEGPRVLLTSGNHGDEYEGQVALMKFVREVQPKDIKGRIIVLPAANFPAAMAGLRTSPIDGGNLNRSFPGDPNGTVTEQIAYYIETVLLAQSDFACDMHSGGSSLMYVPSALARRFDDRAKTQESVDLLRAFGAPVGYLTDAPQGADRTLTAGGERQGVRTMGTELGGTGTVTPAALRVGESGLRRVLGLVGSLVNPPKEKPPETRLMEVRGWDYYVYAPDNGLWEPLVELGDAVEAGQPAAVIHFPDTPWREPAVAKFERAGTVICKRIPGRTERGDCLFHLGTDVKF